jgi:glutaredoxin-like protein
MQEEEKLNMSLLKKQDQDALRQQFRTLTQPVTLVLFTEELNCQYCRETKQLLEEVTALSDKLTLQVLNLHVDKEQAQDYQIDKTPALVIKNGKDYGIRQYGIPSGYEFASLIQDIQMVSAGDSGLKPKTKAALQEIDAPLHFQVFVTPTCPYCPAAVLTAHKMAMENDLIRADMVEANEFPDLTEKYGVMGVPRVVINEHHFFEGALPEEVFLLAALNALGKDTSELEAEFERAQAEEEQALGIAV